jgi:hypothetical protein
MLYGKKTKTGTLKLDQGKARLLGTGIGQAQHDMLGTGAYRQNCVIDTMPASQKRVAPASSTTRPMVPEKYRVDPREVTPAEDTQEPCD